MRKKEFIAQGLEDLPNVAKSFLDTFSEEKIFAISGEMGAGKTTFILALLKAMGVENADGSPTYSIVNSYESNLYGKIYHLDVYRLENEEEAYDIGIEEMLYGEGFCFIEWAEKIENILPDTTIWAYLRKNEEDDRLITVVQ